MLRRTANSSSSGSGGHGGGGPANNKYPHVVPASRHRRHNAALPRAVAPSSNAAIARKLALACVVALLLVGVERHTAVPAASGGRNLHNKALREQQTLPLPARTTTRDTAAATAAMLRQPSDYVEGEKRLKTALSVLRERQERGVDVGVDHLTGWKGEDVPVWKPQDGSVLKLDGHDKSKEEKVPTASSDGAQGKSSGDHNLSGSGTDMGDAHEKNALQKQEEARKQLDVPEQQLENHSDLSKGKGMEKDKDSVDNKNSKGMFDEEMKNELHDAEEMKMVKKEEGAVSNDNDEQENEITLGQNKPIAEVMDNMLVPEPESNEEEPLVPADHDHPTDSELPPSAPDPEEEAGNLDAVSADSLHGKVVVPDISADINNNAGTPPEFGFPTPFDPEARALFQPAFGFHRPNVDAVFALAEGYDLSIYLAFLQSLRHTGFDGDVVLSVSSPERMKPEVEEYLRAQQHLVVYTVRWDCSDRSGHTKTSAGEGQYLCKILGLYEEGARTEVLDDPRDARPVATARYELYWIWATQYQANSTIMLIDARDTYFQTNPFADLERKSENEIKESGGILHLFEENVNATNIRTSSFNSRWIKSAYGADGEQYMDNPILCSGSTMGQQIALEVYLRKMVAEFDRTKCTLKGCDQGFHNYLYYAGKLEYVPEIDEIRVHHQGHGIINNLAALRQNTLSDLKVLDSEQIVRNYDGSVSPVAHQFDRDNELRLIVGKRKKQFYEEWKKERNVLRNKEYESLHVV